MTAEPVAKSRTESLVILAREQGTDFLLDAIHESRVGVSNAFTDETAMNQVIRTARKMLEEKETS